MLSTNYPLKLKALVVAGGWDGNNWLSSVLSLLPGTTTWAPLASLPVALVDAQASIVGGRLRINGGVGGDSYRTEVMIEQ